MKKILLMSFMAVALMFVGCAPDDEGDDTLKGTTWEATVSNVLISLDFNSSTARLTIGSGSSASFVEYTYSYTPPTVLMHPKDSGMADVEGTITGSSIRLVNTSSGETLYTLTKK